MSHTVTLHIRRTHGWADYVVTVADDAYVLDALEAAGRQDPTLLFRHSCHHASCGSCGLRVNGRERLACSTRIDEVWRPGRKLRLEPLRNLPLLGDLLVDLGPVAARIETVGLPLIRAVEPEVVHGRIAPCPSPGEGGGEGSSIALASPVNQGGEPAPTCPPVKAEPGATYPSRPANLIRFESCIECGLCISACPVAGSDARYWGPAALAAAARVAAEPRGRDVGAALEQVDGEDGLWRCHGVFECSEVCPSHVDPAGAIMGLRRLRLGGHGR